jgi:hypothetical protein
MRSKWIENIIRLMTEPDHYTLYRKLHASSKNDDDLFHIIYTLADDYHSQPSEGEEHKESRKEYVAKIVDRGEPEKKPLPNKPKHRKGSVDVKESIKVEKPKHKREHRRDHNDNHREDRSEEADKSEDNS